MTSVRLSLIARLVIARFMFALLVIAGGEASTAVGQVVAINGTGEDAGPDGFRFETDGKLQDTLTDFRRHADRGLFEKAIEVLEGLETGEASGALLESEEGVLLPAAEQVFRVQAEMPAEMRDAFRIFQDARARKAFEEAFTDGLPDAEKLEAVRQRYFISSIGDEASNLLGDLALRGGDGVTAARRYREVLDYHPDSELSAARMTFKVGLAEAAAGDMRAASRTLATLRDRYADAAVRFAGREVNPAEVLASRVRPRDETTDRQNPATRPRGTLAETLHIDWRHRFLTEAQHSAIARSDQHYYYKGVAHYVPPAAVAGGRIAYNLFGSIGFLDAATGKLVSRSEMPSTVVQQMNQNMYGLTLDAYGLTADGGQFLVRSVPTNRLNYSRVGPSLTVYNAAEDDLSSWTTGSGSSRSSWYYLGDPCVVETDGSQRVYVVATRSQGDSEAYLKIHSGDTSREVSLGRYRDLQMQNYSGRRLPNPVVRAFDAETLLIFLDEGLLLAFSTAEDRVLWGIRLPTPPRATSGGGGAVSLRLHPRSSLRMAGRVAYVKDGERARVAAVDVAGRQVLWSRRAAAESQIVAVDEDHVYLLGEDMTALRREDGELAWSVPLPTGNGGLSCVLLEDTLAVFTDRGLFELRRGDGGLARIHREVEPDSSGGRVLLAGGRLITVSERNVTAYPVEGLEAASAEPPPSGEVSSETEPTADAPTP